MITVDTVDYDCQVRVANRSAGRMILIELPHELIGEGRVGRRELVVLISSINEALRQIQAGANQ